MLTSSWQGQHGRVHGGKTMRPGLVWGSFQHARMRRAGNPRLHLAPSVFPFLFSLRC